jgi:hypothetical protein
MIPPALSTSGLEVYSVPWPPVASDARGMAMQKGAGGTPMKGAATHRDDALIASLGQGNMTSDSLPPDRFGIRSDAAATQSPAL